MDTMKSIESWKGTGRRAAALSAVTLLLSISAMAELGGTLSTVQADQHRMSATRQVRQSAAYSVHEMRTATNSVIREYVSPQGKVFAVRYEGQFLGEANSLLAGYATPIGTAIKTTRSGLHRGGPVHVSLPGVEYHATGHMRSYVVYAVLTDSVPQGVNLGELQ
jgi:hypothetical protein